MRGGLVGDSREGPSEAVDVGNCLQKVTRVERFTIATATAATFIFSMIRVKYNKIKNQVVESGSTQVRTIHDCDTQLLYGASGPTVSEMAVVGQVTHVRCKVMYRCVCARHCAVETDTQQGYRQRADNKQTNLGSYSIPTELMSLSHDDSHAITPYLGNKVICD